MKRVELFLDMEGFVDVDIGCCFIFFEYNVCVNCMVNVFVLFGVSKGDCVVLL